MIKNLNKAVNFINQLMSSSLVKFFRLELKYVSTTNDIISIYSTDQKELNIMVVWSSDDKDATLMVYKYDDFRGAKGFLLKDLIKLPYKKAELNVLKIIGRIFYTLYGLDDIIHLVFRCEYEAKYLNKFIKKTDTEFLANLKNQLLKIKDIDEQTMNPNQLSLSKIWKLIYDIIDKELEKRFKDESKYSNRIR